jgi:hypothetical protein
MSIEERVINCKKMLAERALVTGQYTTNEAVVVVIRNQQAVMSSLFTMFDILMEKR